MTAPQVKSNFFGQVRSIDNGQKALGNSLNARVFTDFQLASGWMVWIDPPPAYASNRLGQVMLRGIAQKTGGVPSSFETICLLPQGLRPEHTVRVAVCSGGPDQYGRIDITPDGWVRWVAGGPNWISLDGISFALPSNLS